MSGRSGTPHETAAVERPVAVEDVLDGFGVQPMFLDQDPRGQSLRRVVVENRHGGLEHDRPPIEFPRHEMDCRTGDPDSMGPGLTLRLDTWKGREQRGGGRSECDWETRPGTFYPAGA